MRYTFMRFPEGKTKAVTLSYDDNAVENKKFSDIITGYGLKCTFNLNSCKSNELFGNLFTVEDAKKYILERGHEIAVHGAFHKANGIVRTVEGIRDVLDCRLEFEESYGRIIRGMAYPDTGIRKFLNTDYETIKAYLKSLDIVYSRTLGEDNRKFNMPQDWYAWMPTVKHNNPESREIAQEFVNLDISSNYLAGQESRLFYMWGHTYEFERADGWKLLYDLCDILANHNDIWYATNMEIYEYTKAYETLVWSADSKMVYNPTVFTIWFEVDREPYKINSGETIRIGE